MYLTTDGPSADLQSRCGLFPRIPGLYSDERNIFQNNIDFLYDLARRPLPHTHAQELQASDIHIPGRQHKAYDATVFLTKSMEFPYRSIRPD